MASIMEVDDMGGREESAQMDTDDMVDDVMEEDDEGDRHLIPNFPAISAVTATVIIFNMFYN